MFEFIEQLRHVVAATLRKVALYMTHETQLRFSILDFGDKDFGRHMFHVPELVSLGE